MIRSYCVSDIKTHRCGRIIRARRSYKFCRSCYLEITGKPRPIDRVKKVKVVKTKPTPTTTSTGKRKK